VFSAKESIFKAWYPLAESWLDFKDVEVTIDREARTFTSRLVAADGVACEIGLATFDGRFLIADGFILTAVIAARGPGIGEGIPADKLDSPGCSRPAASAGRREAGRARRIPGDGIDPLR
jgi:hypothetical protein